DVGRAAQTASLCILMKDSANEEGVIADVSPKQERFVLGGAGKRDQHVREILAWRFVVDLRRLQGVRTRKIFQERADVIAQFAIPDSSVAQDIARQNIKVKLRVNSQLSVVAENGLDETRRIKDGIAGLGIGQKVDQGNGFGLGTRESADDKIEIHCGKPRPTIRLNHRASIMSTGDAKKQELTRAQRGKTRRHRRLFLYL